MASILIVDDELEITDYLRDFFTQRGLEVFTAYTGEAGLKLFTEKKPDVVLLDIKLGEGMSGVEMLRKAKAVHPESRFIMVTAVDDVNVSQMARGFGADAYITKPFGSERLEKIVLSKLKD